jgi:hypothetical protein
MGYLAPEYATKGLISKKINIYIYIYIYIYSICRNPSLGLVTKAMACKGVGQKGSPDVTSHAFGSAKRV